MKKMFHCKKYSGAAGMCVCVFLLVCSCATTKPAAVQHEQAAAPVAERKKVPAAPAVVPDQDDIKLRASQAMEKQFIEKTSGLVLSVQSSPKQTTKGIAFSSAYTVKVTDQTGKAVPGFSVTISCPSSRTNDSIMYTATTAVTSTEGMISFLPETPEFAFDNIVTFYPTPVSSDPAVMQAALSAGVTAPFKVVSDYAHKPGIVYVFDFSEDGKAGTNSQYLLRELINSGVRVGNAPIPTSAYLSKPVTSLYNATYKIVGTTYAFMISGSVKYTQPVEKNENGKYVCSLIAEITCIDMKNGSVVYTTQRTQTAEAESKFKAVDECRQQLATKTAHAVLYGM